jgi:ATP-dependent DNA helicase RecQ
MHDPLRVIRGFDRPEIHLSVQCFHDRADKDAAVLRAARQMEGRGLVYAAPRRQACDIAARLCVRPYHAGLPKAERADVHRAFVRGDTVVATSAFGMGIDHPDVRFVIHASVPGSLNEYYQQIGRAGRDSKPAAALGCYLPSDLALPRFFTVGLPDQDLLAAAAQAAARPMSRRELAGRLDISPRRPTGLLRWPRVGLDRHAPATVLGLMQALQYLQANAGRLLLDRDRIALAGDSAGAHIAA